MARTGLIRSLPGVVLVLALIVPAVAAQGTANAESKELQDNYELMRMFAETFEQIDQNYVKDLDRRELMEAAIQGMLQRLDQYSSYIPREEMDRFNQIVEQEYGGVGIQVNVDRQTGRLTVVTPLPGGPAYFKGVRAGDVIVEINGDPTDGFTTDEAVARLKGPRGAEVTIGVKRADSGPEDPVEQITIVRDIVQLTTVRGDTFRDGNWDFMLDDKSKVGYIRLTHFSRHSAEEFSQALDTLQNQGMKALILDLRDNPGGLLRQAVAIADMFVEDVSTRGRNVPEQKWEAHKPGTYSGFPMAVLVNRVSASASEILSACLQDHDRAVVIGERTWGKGSVQNVINLEQGRSALKLTTASYFRPSGRNIHRFPDSEEDDEWGVSPTEGFEVRMTPEERFRWRIDRQQRDRILEDAPETQETPSFADRQLQKAKEYVLSKLGQPADAADAVAPDKKSEK